MVPFLGKRVALLPPAPPIRLPKTIYSIRLQAGALSVPETPHPTLPAARNRRPRPHPAFVFSKLLQKAGGRRMRQESETDAGHAGNAARPLRDGACKGRRHGQPYDARNAGTDKARTGRLRKSRRGQGWKVVCVTVLRQMKGPCVCRNRQYGPVASVAFDAKSVSMPL